MTGEQTEHQHLFSKGIHLIVPQITPRQHILTFFADDGRLFFVIPMGVRTCIGTTDTRVEAPFTEVTDEDRDFVLENINKRLRLQKPLTRDDIIAERCGVRPLVVRRKADQTATANGTGCSSRASTRSTSTGPMPTCRSSAAS
jgi:glycerol-3-phosphate dehydrogenase